MKTEQEQIEAMASIIAETLQDKRVENGATFVSYLPSLLGSADKEKEVAESLVQAGYGDVSEYKAEIERLKADFDSLKEDYEFVRECDNKHCLEIKETVKQAQIDVLNKVKEKLEDCTGCYIPDCFESPTDDFAYDAKEVEKIIDELIKEVQNGEDNG